LPLGGPNRGARLTPKTLGPWGGGEGQKVRDQIRVFSENPENSNEKWGNLGTWGFNNRNVTRPPTAENG